jgi:hypothetical protein
VAKHTKISEILVEATMAEASDKTCNEARDEVGSKAGMSKHE